MAAGGERFQATARRISQSRPRWPSRLLLAAFVSAAATAPLGAEVKRLAFPVTGMHSPLATRGVEEAIRQLPGVARVSADRSTGRVQVEAEILKSLNLQEVRTRAARAGFPVAGDLDVLARGRFETGAEGRITFKVAGTSYAWQVLESGTLLEMIRSHPGLRGEFVAGFRLFEKPPWNRPAISLTGWEAVPGATPAGPRTLRPQEPASKPQPAKPAGKVTASAAKSKAPASSATAARKPAAKQTNVTAAAKKKAEAPAPAETKKKRRKDPAIDAQQ